MNYSEIREELEDIPQTWCPALLVTLVRTCVRKKVFREGGLVATVKQVEKEELKNPKGAKGLT